MQSQLEVCCCADEDGDCRFLQETHSKSPGLCSAAQGGKATPAAVLPDLDSEIAKSSRLEPHLTIKQFLYFNITNTRYPEPPQKQPKTSFKPLRNPREHSKIRWPKAYGSFRKLGIPYLGVLIIGILLFRVPYWGPLFSEAPIWSTYRAPMHWVLWTL